MRFTHIDIDFDITYKGSSKYYQKEFLTNLMTFMCDAKIDISMCKPHCVSLFFVWASFTLQVLDFLTFDIFLTIWHLLTFWHIT